VSGLLFGERRIVTYKLRVLSLGAGIQSTTLYIMAEEGLIPPFDCAIFADTGWERDKTYNVINELQSKYKTPIITVKAGNIKDNMLEAKETQSRFATMPLYCVQNNNKGMMRRQCTEEYKITPINKELRKLLGLKPRQRYTGDAIDFVLGISLDESVRANAYKESKYKTNSYPLINLKMDRNQCEHYLDQHNIDVVKSACIGCPYHTNKEWRSLDKNEFTDACSFDAQIRNGFEYKKIKSQELYLHSSCQPLADVDMRTAEEKGQLRLFDYTKQELFIKLTE
jgi:3'-phosphoadenosine 5'-phosphosulfate sulfotransferase (PAPS reductase)/FAD synthetase